MRLFERSWRSLLTRLARDWSFVPGGTRPGGRASRDLIIAPRHMPTIDYYLQELLDSAAREPARLVYDADVARWLGASAAERIEPGTRVVLVRMPDRRWAKVIEAARDKVVEVIWLIDDDVVAARDDSWLPDDYRLRLLSDYARFRRHFAHQVDRVWASTAPIAARFPASRVEIRPPQPIPPRAADEHPVTIFYHGTSSHRREHAFLLPIFRRVQAASTNTLIEVAGGHAVYRMFRGVPRLRVVHPVPWPDYLQHLRAGNYQIGLVPLLDTPFNRGRTGIKVFEIAAIGARGVVSRCPAHLEHQHLPGIHLLDDSEDAWVERILKLANELGGCR
jgi:hypothetical protein